MAFKDILFRRLEILIEAVLKGEDVDIGWASKLGASPLRFDDVYIHDEFRGRLNGNPLGFADLLVKKITKSEIDESTTIREVIELILEKSSVDTRDLYEVKMSERVRLGLRGHVAKLAQPPVDEEAVVPTNTVAGYVPDGSMEALRNTLTVEFEKYLIGGPIRKGDLQGTLNAAKDAIVLRMLA